jgi:hypothetical protein
VWFENVLTAETRIVYESVHGPRIVTETDAPRRWRGTVEGMTLSGLRRCPERSEGMDRFSSIMGAWETTKSCSSGTHSLKESKTGKIVFAL